MNLSTWNKTKYLMDGSTTVRMLAALWAQIWFSSPIADWITETDFHGNSIQFIDYAIMLLLFRGLGCCLLLYVGGLVGIQTEWDIATLLWCITLDGGLHTHSVLTNCQVRPLDKRYGGGCTPPVLLLVVGQSNKFVKHYPSWATSCGVWKFPANLIQFARISSISTEQQTVCV